MIIIKCIFLDFDGVINNWNYFDSVSKDNVLVLKKIIEISNANIIATTSNKYSLQRGYVDFYNSNFYRTYVSKLKEYGIEIYDLTPLCDCNRTLEIKKFLFDNSVEQFVILDDELIDEELQDHQVYLDMYRGLQMERINPAIRILNGELGFFPKDYDKTETSKQRIIRINKHHKNK